jgi:phospholipase C
LERVDMTPDQEAELTRRQLLIRGAGIAGAAGAASILGPTGIARAATAVAPAALPPPDQSGIEHIVVLMMENRSFDHMLGWLPGANGIQDGLSFLDQNGVLQPTTHLTEFQGCGHPDPDHSFAGGRIQLDGGACDGWLWGNNDEFSIGYYTASDLPFYGQAAPYWTAFDQYHAAIMAETYPNRFYQHCAQTDRIHNSQVGVTTLPSIWDELDAAGISHAYYYTDVPFTAIWGSKYLSFTHPFSQFVTDCQNGTLPAVSYLDPKFIDEGSGTSADDHPHSDIRAGQSFLNIVYYLITHSPNWPNTVFVINYDEWGGFFDHVAPPLATDTDPNGRLRGFRVPALMISPFARRHYVGHKLYDHTSVLKMIEWRYGLNPLTARDAAARNIAEVLNFNHPDLTAPVYSVPNVVGQACPTTDQSEFADWKGVRDLAVRSGFRLP